jgi:GntR family transcriptional regulator, carbon starvation induced regulator
MHPSHEASAGDPATLAASVYQRLRADIISGSLEPGYHLRLAALRQRYGVGLSPIREALSRLASDTFVTAYENRGYRVAELSRADLLDLTATRVLIERDALRQAIAQGDEQWEADIVAAHYRLTKVDARLRDASSALLDEWETANRSFHDALVAACRSHWLQRFRRLLQDQSKRYRRFSLQESARYRAVQEEHTRLLEATLARDTPRALELVEAHIRATAENILDRIPAGR